MANLRQCRTTQPDTLGNAPLLEDLLAKHYMGMHDQSTHGDRFGGSGEGLPKEIAQKRSSPFNPSKLSDVTVEKARPFLEALSEGKVKGAFQFANDGTPYANTQHKNGDALTWHLREALRYNDPAKVVRKDALDQVVKNGGKELWRGASKRNHDNLVAKDHNWYTGFGVYGNAMYAGGGDVGKSMAKSYIFEEHHQLLRMALAPHANVFDAPQDENNPWSVSAGHKYLKVAARAALVRAGLMTSEFAPKPTDPKIIMRDARMSALIEDNARAAMILGYDAVKNSSMAGENWVVLNRSVLYVQGGRWDAATLFPGDFKKSLLKHYEGMHDQSTHGNRMGGVGVASDHREFISQVKAYIPPDGVQSSVHAEKVGAMIHDYVESRPEVQALRDEAEHLKEQSYYNRFSDDRKLQIQGQRQAVDAHIKELEADHAHTRLVWEILPQIRSFGGNPSFAPDVHESVVERFNDVTPRVPSEWIQEANKSAPMSVKVNPYSEVPQLHIKERAMTFPPNWDPKTADFGHEYMHLLIASSPRLAYLEHAYWESRRGNEQIKVGTVGGHEDYMYVDDHWANEYARSIYVPGTGQKYPGYEVMTTGFEEVAGFTEGTLHEIDPSHYNFVLGMLAGAKAG